MPPEPAPDPEDTLVPRGAAVTAFASGRYVVRGLLGEGGQKVVYLVHDEALDRDCALSMVKTELLEPDDLERLRREAQAMARLGAHSNIVTVHDIGDEDGKPYLVCEYVPAGELRRHLRDAAAPLPLERTLAIAADIARALAVAHGRGVIHRDVKPANVWLCEDGSAKLGDFGLAFSLDRSRLTMPGTVMGTAAYLSPEQALGQPVTERSDLYALGCLLYEMVCGKPPFADANPTAVIAQHINAAPVAPSSHQPDLSPAVEDLILRLLAKSPDERPEGAAIVLDELRRITDRLRAPEVSSEPEPESESENQPAAPGFVGRTPELEQLAAALDRAMGGAGSLVMLVGEPGIGKTRTADEFCAHARAAGAQVLWGRCYDGDWAPPFSPFMEALRDYARRVPLKQLRAALGAEAGVIARIVPALRELLPDIEEPHALQSVQGEDERHRLPEAVSDVLTRLGAKRTLVLVLDDLHWADKGTIAVLRHVARACAAKPVMLLGAYRDVELDRQHPLAAALADLRRDANCERIVLKGLDAVEVGELLDVIAEQDVPRALADAISAETSGNPFFIREVLLHLVEERKIVLEDGRWTSALSIADMRIPEGVREVIGRRLSRLSDPCNRMLTAASALTGGFSWAELCAISGEPEPLLLDALDEALNAQLLAEHRDGTDASYDFTHALIRHTLYQELSAPRRSLLHRQIGEALERLYAADIESHVSSLGYHFYAAGAAGDLEKGVDYLYKAGRRAFVAWADEDAAAQFRRALELLDYLPTDTEHRRCDVLVQLALAESASDPIRSMAHALEASDLATRLSESKLLAEAALAYRNAANAASFFGELRGGFQERETIMVGLFESALASLPGTDTNIRVQLLAALGLRRLGGSLGLGTIVEQADGLTLINEAFETASRLGEPEASWTALQARLFTLRGPDTVKERLGMADELFNVAQAAGWNAAWVHLLRGQTLMELGDVASADRELLEYERLASTPDQRLWLMAWKAMRSLFAGNALEAERLAFEAIAAAQKATRVQGTHLQAILPLYFLRREQGRLQEFEPAIKALADDLRDIGVLYCVGLAFLYAETGRFTEARKELDRIPNFDDLIESQKSEYWLLLTGLVAETAWAVDDPSLASRVYDVLRPYQGLNITGTVAFSAGPVARLLGMLAGTMLRWDEANEHFAVALDLSEGMGTPLWVGYTQYHWGATLLARGVSDDRERALERLDAAKEIADRLGLIALREKIERTRTS